MVQKLGYHDAYGSGVIHAICGGAALGILVHLGPRLGRFMADGTPRNFPPRDAWLVIIGIFLLYTGFWGFYAACHTPIAAIASDTGAVYFSALTVYGTPTTLGAVTVNYLFSLVGGMFMGYWVTGGDPFWTFSGGIAASSRLRRATISITRFKPCFSGPSASIAPTSFTFGWRDAFKSTMRWEPWRFTATAG